MPLSPVVKISGVFQILHFLSPFGYMTLCNSGTRRFALETLGGDFKAARGQQQSSTSSTSQLCKGEPAEQHIQHLTALQRGTSPAVPNRWGREAAFYCKTLSSFVLLPKLLPAGIGRDFNCCFESVPDKGTCRLSLNILDVAALSFQYILDPSRPTARAAPFHV